MDTGKRLSKSEMKSLPIDITSLPAWKTFQEQARAEQAAWKAATDNASSEHGSTSLANPATMVGILGIVPKSLCAGFCGNPASVPDYLRKYTIYIKFADVNS